MAMAPLQSSLYGSFPPQQPVAMIVLIENSLAMQHVWNDLRDQYLRSLVDNLTADNIESGTPITVSVLESYPCQDHGPNPSLPRQYSGQHDGLFDDIMFSPNPENKISIGRINSCIDFLDSFKFQGQPAALHLVIVAATVPSDDTPDTSRIGNDYSPWIFLAKKMADKHIHCHIVVSPQHDTGSLTMLFEETTNVEGQLYPPVDPSRMVVRISVKPTQKPYTDAVSTDQYPVQRMPVPRRSSYSNPAENFYPEGFDPVGAPPPNDGELTPSLVTQLQQVHGLTKKKVYGAKPARQPFFREERVHSKYRNAPTPLTMPLPVVEQTPSPTAGGRAISQSRADRMARVGQGSPTELHSRRPHGWPRRGSRLSTPEADNLAWPSTSPSTFQDTSPRSSFISSVSSDISSPVTPVATMDEMYGIPKPIASGASTSIHGMSPAMNHSGYQTGGMPEPSWQQQQHAQFTDVYTGAGTYYSPQPPPTTFFNSTSGDFNHKNDMQVQSVVEQGPSAPAPSALVSSPYDVYMMDASSMMLPPQNPAPPSAPAPVAAATRELAPRPPMPKRAAPQDDDERFTFSQDFVAATAALFDDEVLPAYPNYPGMRSGLLPRGSMPVPLHPAAQPGELYATRLRSSYPAPPKAGPPPPGGQGYGGAQGGAHAHARAMPYANTYGNGYPVYGTPAHPPAYGSSLTGWAG